jgi:hypothetical protein
MIGQHPTRPRLQGDCDRRADDRDAGQRDLEETLWQRSVDRPQHQVNSLVVTVIGVMAPDMKFVQHRLWIPLQCCRQR